MNKAHATASHQWLWVGLTILLGVQAPFGQAASPDTDADKSKAAPMSDFMTRKTMTDNWFGAGNDWKDLGISFSLSYQHQWQQNFRGGLATHNAHRQSGSYDAVIKLDFEKMGLIDDAGFYFKFKGTWGEGIRSGKVGSLARVNSDIGGDQPIFVKKWWYWQKFMDKKVEVRLGMIETNKDLVDVSLYANHEDKDFLNRRSIRNTTIPHRTGIGAYVLLKPVDWFYALAATVDAQSEPRQTGFNTAFHDEDKFIGFWEFGFTPEWETSKGPMPGRYRAGLHYDPTPRNVFIDDLDGTITIPVEGDAWGFYVGLDQLLWKENDDPADSQGLGWFSRYGFGHEDVALISHYWSTGVSYTGLFPQRDKDVTGFAVSQGILSKQYRNEINSLADRETVYEWYYKWHVTPWLAISPDLQVITNPGGDKNDRDAVVGGLRLRIIF